MLVVTLNGKLKNVPLSHRAVTRTVPLGRCRASMIRRALALLLARSGYAPSHIAEVLGVHHSTACRLIKAAGDQLQDDPDDDD